MAIVLPVSIATPVEAKTPGSTYCYHGVCHRVKTIEETEALVGQEETLIASDYDDCKNDRFNPCGLTSSGEIFHADRPDNTASPIYPDGTTLLVWNPETERALVVRVNNAGPYYGDRTLDLSHAAAERLGFDGQGVASLRVRVVKAPEPEEAVYVDHRNYPPVPGDIGAYASLEAAHTGMAVALAFQASATSLLAPVTTASVFSTFNSEQLVAEAPQALGRAAAKLASAHSANEIASLSPVRFSDPSLAMSQQQAAAQPQAAEAEKVAALEKEEKPVAAQETPTRVASSEEADEPAQSTRKQRSARRGKDIETSSRRSSHGTRVARAERRYERPRVAYDEPRVAQRSRFAGRTAEQTMSANLRAAPASSM